MIYVMINIPEIISGFHGLRGLVCYDDNNCKFGKNSVPWMLHKNWDNRYFDIQIWNSNKISHKTVSQVPIFCLMTCFLLFHLVFSTN